jgi:hypothetical protein
MGYLYIITNEAAFPGWVKVGTTENIDHRMSTYQTGDPFRQYKVEYILKHPKFKEAEKRIKEFMKPFALEIKNEWYRIDKKMAMSRLDEQLDDFKNGEFN